MRIPFSKSVKAAMLASALAITAVPAAAITYTDYSFLSGSPVEGSALIGGVNVSIRSINTFMGGITTLGPNPNVVAMAFDNAREGTDSALIFSFDKAISEFAIGLDRMKVGEVFGSSLGTATSVLSNYLFESGTGRYIVDASAGDFGSGTLLWKGLNTTSLSVLYSCDGICGPLPAPGNILTTSFGVSPVPLPATLPLLAGVLGLGGVVAARRRRRTT